MEITDQISRTFAEYRFIPRLTKESLTKDKVDLSTPLTKGGLRLNAPVLSAAMQSVTGPEMAVALAQHGGIGTVFCSQPIDSEADMIKAVKRARAGFVSQLEVINPDDTIEKLDWLIKKTGYNTIPVVEGSKSDYGRFLGIFEGPVSTNMPRTDPVKNWMLPFRQESLEAIVDKMKSESHAEDVIKVVNDYIFFGSPDMTLPEANKLMTESRRKYLSIVNLDGTLKFMVFGKDLQAHTSFPRAVVDDNKRYVVAGSINTHDYAERVPALVDAGVDVLVIDSSDGFSEYQRKCVEFVKSNFKTPVIAGNIISREAFEYLALCGIDGVKVGMGGGSICITQEQKGTGRGQATATLEVAKARDEYARKIGEYIPIISDGGIGTAKDVAMALAFGADSVMMGRYFAGCHESPTKIIERDGKMYKEYWGEGSTRAKAWSGKRYGQNDFDEGVVAVVPYTGRVADNLNETFAKISATMVSLGASNLKELRHDAVVELISDASRIEGGVHDVITDKRV